jgi:hypothetical protein
MTRQVKQRVRVTRGTSAVAPLSAFAAIALCASIWGASEALADQNTPQFHRGACQGAYPGWLRGVVDGYNGLSTSPVADSSSVLQKVPTPKVLQSGDERLGYGDGLKEGFKLGVDFGVELAKAARTPDSDSLRMDRATAQLHAYTKRHCGDLVAALDWNTTFMNAAETSTVASLNEAQVAMGLASNANQAALGAEEMARGAREAEAKGDQLAALKFRAAAQVSAQLAANLAQMARSHAVTGREEAVQAIIDAEAAADRARKAAESAGG